jgi:hypothetical protein
MFFFGLIKQDAVNYPVLQLLKSLQHSGFTIVFFAYSNSRYESIVKDVLTSKGIDMSKAILHTDTKDKVREVWNGFTFKQYLYNTSYSSRNVVFAIDNEEQSIDLWKSNDVFLLKTEYN